MQRYYFSPIYTNPQTHTPRTLIPTLSLSRTHARARHARHDFQTSSSVPFSILKYRKDFEARRTGFHFFEIFGIIALPPNLHTLLWKNYSLTQQTSYLTPISPFIPPNLHLFYPLYSNFYPNFPFKTLFPPYLTNYTPQYLLVFSKLPQTPPHACVRPHAHNARPRPRHDFLNFQPNYGAINTHFGHIPPKRG